MSWNQPNTLRPIALSPLVAPSDFVPYSPDGGTRPLRGSPLALAGAFLPPPCAVMHSVNKRSC